MFSNNSIIKVARFEWERDGLGGVLVTSGSVNQVRLLEERRKIGAFYTPQPLSKILSDWAIKSSHDNVLEPSFGGCGFLQCAQKRLIELGCKDPKKQIYGCDIDPVAFDYLSDVFRTPVDLSRFLQTDFLEISPGGKWPESFSVVLANPPYIPYQALGFKQRQALTSRDWLVQGIGGRASLWAYFLVHSLSFLAKNGRMAWVLPGAFLQADYAKAIRSFLAKAFGRVAAIVIHERIFLEAGADEETVILLADGYKNAASDHIELGQVKTLQALQEVILDWDSGRWVGTKSNIRPAALNILQAQRSLLDCLERQADCRALGDVASIQIGLVTGSNEFFVLDRHSLRKAGLRQSDCTPILAKFVAAPGISFALSDHLSFLSGGGRGYLVDSDGQRPNSRIRTYLETFPSKQRKKTSTFQKRKFWSKPNDGRVPDAFFPVMHHWGPRLVLNPYGITNTNTIHRVYFSKSLDKAARKLVAISLISSFSQLSAEIVGRRYGSGVLKHEPREAERILMLLPKVKPAEIDKVFNVIDLHLRQGNREDAIRCADKLVYASAGIGSWETVSTQLIQALDHIRHLRRPQRGK